MLLSYIGGYFTPMTWLKNNRLVNFS